MPINFPSKITPKNDAFTGLVDADQVLGDGNTNILPDSTISDSIKKHTQLRLESESNLMVNGFMATKNDLIKLDLSDSGQYNTNPSANTEDNLTFEGDTLTIEDSPEVTSWIDSIVHSESNGDITQDSSEANSGSKCGKITISSSSGVVAFKSSSVSIENSYPYGDTRYTFDSGHSGSDRWTKVLFKVHHKKPTSNGVTGVYLQIAPEWNTPLNDPLAFKTSSLISLGTSYGNSSIERSAIDSWETLEFDNRFSDCYYQIHWVNQSAGAYFFIDDLTIKSSSCPTLMPNNEVAGHYLHGQPHLSGSHPVLDQNNGTQTDTYYQFWYIWFGGYPSVKVYNPSYTGNTQYLLIPYTKAQAHTGEYSIALRGSAGSNFSMAYMQFLRWENSTNIYYNQVLYKFSCWVYIPSDNLNFKEVSLSISNGLSRTVKDKCRDVDKWTKLTGFFTFQQKIDRVSSSFIFQSNKFSVSPSVSLSGSYTDGTYNDVPVYGQGAVLKCTVTVNSNQFTYSNWAYKDETSDYNPELDFSVNGVGYRKGDILTIDTSSLSGSSLRNESAVITLCASHPVYQAGANVQFSGNHRLGTKFNVNYNIGNCVIPSMSEPTSSSAVTEVTITCESTQNLDEFDRARANIPGYSKSGGGTPNLTSQRLVVSEIIDDTSFKAKFYGGGYSTGGTSIVEWGKSSSPKDICYIDDIVFSRTDNVAEFNNMKNVYKTSDNDIANYDRLIYQKDFHPAGWYPERYVDPDNSALVTPMSAISDNVNAVNNTEIKSSISGSPITISAKGSDSNIDINLIPKGTGVVKSNGTRLLLESDDMAGKILGYTSVGENSIHYSYTLTTSYAVPDTKMKVTFTAPTSGKVEIMVQIYYNASTSNRYFYLGLSDSSTYNSLGDSYEQTVRYPDETDDGVLQNFWTITGLTAGTSYTYYLGAKISGSTGWLNWGGNTPNRYPDFIMKAVALP